MQSVRSRLVSRAPGRRFTKSGGGSTLGRGLGRVWSRRTRRYGTRLTRPWSLVALTFLPHLMLTATWEDWGEIVRLHDPDDYSGTPVHYFEAMLVTADVTKAARARLYNVTTATPVAESQVAMASSTPDRVRSPPFALPSGENEYKAQIGEP